MVMKLTASQENYLELIWRLHQQGPVRVSEIARLANIRLPSVTKAVGKLVAAGMIQHESYGTFTFTELGRAAAESVARRDACLSRLLAGLLRMPQEEASEEVCRIEHVISDEVLSRLEILLDHAYAEHSAAWRGQLNKKLKALNLESGEVQVGRNSPHAGLSLPRQKKSVSR